jgi:hypothetical protein
LVAEHVDKFIRNLLRVSKNAAPRVPSIRLTRHICSMYVIRISTASMA